MADIDKLLLFDIICGSLINMFFWKRKVYKGLVKKKEEMEKKVKSPYTKEYKEKVKYRIIPFVW